MLKPLSQQAPVYTVSQLNREAKQLLNQHFLTLKVQGEISNLSTPSSGHIYFSLKDAGAQIRCALFRSSLRQVKFRPQNGQQVMATAEVSLYEARGDYQLIVSKLEEAGDGALQAAYEALKKKLAAQGLFDPEHKRPLPLLPTAIGVITSPSGAALRDILTVLKRRFPAIPIVLYPASVQGEQAKFEIAAAIQNANQRAECDVLLVGRGGGSLEDLWCFNEALVAQAIYDSDIPIISGIGHETDTTIADFVADSRAATPSAAAEQLTPSSQEWLQYYRGYENRLQQLLDARLTQAKQRLGWLQRHLQLQRPDNKLQQLSQRLDEIELRMQGIVQLKLAQAQNKLTTHSTQLWQHHPKNKISVYQEKQDYLLQRLQSAMQHQLQQKQHSLSAVSQTLDAVSPLATLNRGYAIVQQLADEKLVTDSKQLQSGDKIKTRLAHGAFISEVETIYEP